MESKAETETGAIVDYQPWKNFIVHSIKETTKEGLCLFISPENGILRWAEGVLFTADLASDHNNIISEEMIKGNLHFETVVFAMEERIPPKGVECRGQTIYVINETGGYLVPLAKWLKMQHRELPQPAITGINQASR